MIDYFFVFCHKATYFTKTFSHFSSIPLFLYVNVVTPPLFSLVVQRRNHSNDYEFAYQNNIQVVPIPGASSIQMALIASGFNGQQFTFHGYLPIKTHLRQQKIRDLEKLSQWAYYLDATDKKSSFINPWLDYKKHGQILLSGNRGKSKLTNIQVYTDVKANTFRVF